MLTRQNSLPVSFRAGELVFQIQRASIKGIGRSLFSYST